MSASKPPTPGTARYRSESAMAERWLAGDTLADLAGDYGVTDRRGRLCGDEVQVILRRVIREALGMRGATLRDSRRVRRAPRKRRKP